MFKFSLFFIALTFSTTGFSASAAEGQCPMNFDTAIVPFIAEATPGLPSYIATKNKAERLQIETAVLDSGANLVVVAGGCAHLTVRFQYSVDPSLSEESDPQNAIEKAEILLKQTPVTRAGKTYSSVFAKGIENAKRAPKSAGTGRINLSDSRDVQLELDYSMRGALVLTYSFAL